MTISARTMISSARATPYNCVTVRDRDTMEQVRMPISELKAYIESKIEF